MENRIGVIGIVVEDRDQMAKHINNILSAYGHLIIGRMGIPFRERDVSVIALIVEGTTDELGALAGKLGSLQGVRVKSALTGRKSGDGS